MPGPRTGSKKLSQRVHGMYQVPKPLVENITMCKPVAVCLKQEDNSGELSM